MGEDKLSYEDLLRIIKLIESSSHFTELHLKVGSVEVDLRRGSRLPPSRGNEPDGGQTLSVAIGVELPQSCNNQQPDTAAGSDIPAHEKHEQMGGGELVLELGDEAAREINCSAASTNFRPGSILIDSPMVGIFYRCPELGAPSFVEVGQRVAPDTTVCIVDVMKLMTTIPAGHYGVVTHILVKDGEQVEPGQALIVIDPAG
jgi:biotin carboxyl carrier protein